MVRAVTCACPVQGASNSGRKVITISADRRGTRSARRSNSSSEVEFDPMRVFKNEQGWLSTGEALELPDQCSKYELALLARVVGQRLFARQSQQIVKHRQSLRRTVARSGEQCGDLVALSGGEVFARKAGGVFQLGNERVERAVAMVRRAEIAQPDMRFALDLLLECRGEAGLTDAGFTGDQHDLPFAFLGTRPASQQQLDFSIAPDERGQKTSTAMPRTGSRPRPASAPAIQPRARPTL